jgi:plasmid stabilization system protein ParE
MSRFLLAPEAARDIEEIVRSIATESVDSALKLQDQIGETFRMLTQFPNAGHTRVDLAGRRKLLFWPVENFLILYRAKARTIEIVAVLHGARDIPTILRHRKTAE